MKRILFVGLMVVATTVVAPTLSAEVYKWVDDNGKTHYGPRPATAGNGTEKTRIKSQVNQKPAETKKIDGEVAEFADVMAREILRDNGDAESVDCGRSVRNAHDSIDTMLSVGERNYKTGYLAEAQYREASTKLRQIKTQISVSECQSATGNTAGFYQCMTNNYNHVVTCGKKYDYGD
ncbi:DUF4124 domain-containing protein [Arenicella chitinivorans]|uniref:DUF4124 domain-containing protein n=1 Tax=Arenicella chitinivorans TaxID=1329800 RepID=UPI0016796036|nr:DUF4124 domain-containing protein [Arenicella chitinivorans]